MLINKKNQEQVFGMKGLAEIELTGGKERKTVIKNLHVKPPILIQKAMYPDTNNPNTAHIYLMSSACGILQGDKLNRRLHSETSHHSYL